MGATPILIVDDEHVIRSELAHSLSLNGHAVETASSGFEALEKFKGGEFSLVITDVKMPRMSGFEVLEEIKRTSPQVPVIMITAEGTINNAVEAMQNGASDYLLKPLSPEALELAVKKAKRDSNGRSKVKFQDSHSRVGPETLKFTTQDSKLLSVFKLAKSIASSNATVLIQGESGTGKEVLASYIHYHGGKKNRPYVAVNCASLPDSLAESELFGHEKGSFTGASNKKIGKFELANHGTIVLDEISEMAIPIQAKLLRAIQERVIDRIGGTKPIPIDVRIIAISNVDLRKAVKEGKFREDLFYRVNVIPFTIPPLRDRKGDIPLLVEHFLKKLNNGKECTKISEKAMSMLLGLDWKGNVRELENIIERARLLGEGEVILPEYLFLDDAETVEKRSIGIKAGYSVREMEKALISKTLEEVNNNRTHAAKMLGISIRTLRNKLQEYRGEEERGVVD